MTFLSSRGNLRAQVQYFLGCPGNLRIIPFVSHPLDWISVDGPEKASYPKIGNNKVSTNESLPLDYARHSCSKPDFLHRRGETNCTEF